MDYKELLELKDIEFSGITEPNTNCLRLYFDRCKVSQTPEEFVIGGKVFNNTYPISIDETLPIIQIDFDSYIGYSITNESFTQWDDYQLFEGKAFRIYSKSRYLDYLKTSTFASEDYPGSFTHYGVVCLNHIVDIVSVSKPIIAEAIRKQMVPGICGGAKPTRAQYKK